MTGPTPTLSGASSVAGNSKTTLLAVMLTGLSAVGGLLFGYDTGVVSGAMLLVRPAMELEDIWHEFIVSGTILSAWIFSLTGGYSADRWGRRRTIMSAAVVFTLGSIIMGSADGKEILLIGRIVVGMGVGLASMSTPVYIAESSPPHLRGTLVTVYTVGITFGQFVAGIVCGVFSEVHDGWRYMLGLAAVPSVILFVGFIFLPESPRWLVSHGRFEEAESVLQRLRGAEASVTEEVKSIRQACEEQKSQQQTQVGTSVLMQILKTPHTRRALFLGCAMQAIQQLAGINTVMYYSASIIQRAGVGDHSTAIWLSAGVAFVNFICTFIGLWAVERLGRRPLTLSSLTGVVFSLLLLGAGFWLMESDSPNVTPMAGIAGECSQVQWCTECVSTAVKCGFCAFTKDNETVRTCLPRDVMTEAAIDGPCMSPAEGVAMTWAVGWCPSEYSWIAVAALVIYLIFFAPGMGPVPWTINSEIHPLWARGVAISITTGTCWFFNLIVTLTFLSVMELLTPQGAFFMYACIAFAGLILLWWLLPETRGVSLEEMEGLFGAGKPRLKEQVKKTASNASASESGKY